MPTLAFARLVGSVLLIANPAFSAETAELISGDPYDYADDVSTENRSPFIFSSQKWTPGLEAYRTWGRESNSFQFRVGHGEYLQFRSASTQNGSLKAKMKGLKSFTTNDAPFDIDGPRNINYNRLDGLRMELEAGSTKATEENFGFSTSSLDYRDTSFVLDQGVFFDRIRLIPNSKAKIERTIVDLDDTGSFDGSAGTYASTYLIVGFARSNLNILHRDHYELEDPDNRWEPSGYGVGGHASNGDYLSIHVESTRPGIEGSRIESLLCQVRMDGLNKDWRVDAVYLDIYNDGVKVAEQDLDIQTTFESVVQRYSVHYAGAYDEVRIRPVLSGTIDNRYGLYPSVVVMVDDLVFQTAIRQSIFEPDSGGDSTVLVDDTDVLTRDGAVIRSDSRGENLLSQVPDEPIPAFDPQELHPRKPSSASNTSKSGTATVNSVGNWTYTPNADYTATDSFTPAFKETKGSIRNTNIGTDTVAAENWIDSDDSLNAFLNKGFSLSDLAKGELDLNGTNHNGGDKTSIASRVPLESPVADDCNCSGNGICFEGTCICNQGWMGADCSVSTCSPACVNGTCVGGICICNQGWMGADCSVSTCSPACVNGACVEGICVCNQGWTGIACDEITPTEEYYWFTRFAMPDGVREGTQIDTEELEIEIGNLAISTNGLIIGSAGNDPITGTATELADECVDLTIAMPSKTRSLDAYRDLGETLLVAQATEVGEANELFVFPKKPSFVSNADIDGEWAFVALETPSFVGSEGNNSGNVGISKGAATFDSEVGMVSFDFETFKDHDSGAYTISGPFNLGSNGYLQLEGIGSFYLNRGLDIAVSVLKDLDGGADSQEVFILARKPNSATTKDLVGVWRIFFTDVSRVNDGNINNTVFFDFEGRTELVSIADIGNGIASLTSQDPDGLQAAPLTIEHDGTITLERPVGDIHAFLAAGKEIFILTTTSSNTLSSGDFSNDYKIGIAVKTTSPFVPLTFNESVGLQIISSADDSIQLHWNRNPGRVLQFRDSLSEGVWQNIDHTAGFSSYTDSIPDGARFYRVRAEWSDKDYSQSTVKIDR